MENAILNLKHLSKSFDGKQILDDLNIDIERLDDYELLCEEDILGKEQPF